MHADLYQLSSVAQLCLTLCNPMDCSTPGLPVYHQFPEFAQIMSIELVMPSNHLALCRPLLLPPSVFPSIRVFSTESVLHIRWPKYWSFSFSASVLPANIPDCLPLGLTGLIALCPRDSQEFSPTPQCISINSFFMVQLSYPYMTTGKTIALTIRTFVGNVSAF